MDRPEESGAVDEAAAQLMFNLHDLDQSGTIDHEEAGQLFAKLKILFPTHVTQKTAKSGAVTCAEEVFELANAACGAKL